MSRGGAVVAVLAVALAAILFVVLRDEDDGDGGSEPAATSGANGGERQGGSDGDEGSARPRVETIVVEGGRPVGGVAEIEFARGERIRFAVESDVADEVHLHGYDVSRDVAAGGRVVFDVPADAEGLFEVELEAAGVPLAEITVTPD